MRAHECGTSMAYKQITGIYEIRTPSNRVYYGSAVCVTGRINMHKRELRNGIHLNHILQRAWNRYGNEMTFSLVEECERSRLRELEQEYISSVKSKRRRMNIDSVVCELAPAEVHSKRMKGAWSKRTPEQKAAIAKKISETLKKRYRENPEMLEKTRKAAEKAREAAVENKHTPEARAKRSAAMKAAWAKKGPEERAAIASKISSAMKEKYTPEERSEMSRAGGYACKGVPKKRLKI